MWIVMTRAPKADAPHWAGRTGLAAIDAVAWPLFWVVVLRRAPASTDVVGPVVDGIALVCALARLQRAVWMNHRYWFTTWRWAKVAASLLLMGWVLKLTI